jgi:peptide/nickel transport system substrate-binding protein
VPPSNGSSGESDPPRTRAGERPSPEPGPSQPTVRTFLIADVRGYTPFTQEHGDEAAGRLAAAFAELSREAVEAHGGEVIELRGDEALCVFGSARQALRAAVELQTRFRDRTDDGPVFPLPIGIGLDAGEAVPIEGGYRGGALNTAARLCSVAGPGQILATDTVVSLARRLDGIRFVTRRPLRLKGIDAPVRVLEVVPETELPPPPEIPAQKHPLPVTSRRLAAAAIAATALLATLLAFVVTRSTGDDFLSRLEANAIGVIDADAAGIESQLSVGSKPGAIAAGGGFLWVASEEGTVSRVDPETRAVQTLAGQGSASGIAHGGGSVWVTNFDERTVTQIRPDSLTEVQTVDVGNGPAAVAVGEGAVWVANTIDWTVSRFDLAEGAVTETIPVGASPVDIAVGGEAVWVASEATGTVLRLDPRSGSVVQAVNVGNGPTGIAVGEGDVWVANRHDGTISRIDPTTNSVTATARVGAAPSAVVAGEGAVWVANAGDGTIVRVDPNASRIDETVSIESSPNALALAADSVWTTTAPSFGSHRGGVLRVESIPFECGCIDPTVAAVPEFAILALAYDGLIGYRRTGGSAGVALVGNLAARVPTPSDEGKTYTFQLRSNIRYSDGTRVRPSDFRSSLERALVQEIPPYFGAIVGASDCSPQAPGRCDLSRGIQVDDAAGTITVRLTEPDPDFLYKLTLLPASVVPFGTPRAVAVRQPIPSTGPYRIASYEPDRELRLVRNPSFRVWSRDARPDGYPDEIRFHLTKNIEASIAAVEEGKADWVSEAYALPVERLRGLLARYPGRLHSDPAPWTDWMFLNTRVPPFDNLQVRQALNFAADRRKLVEALGGPAAARATCQILPAGFPGYEPYCPYTRDPKPRGAWSAQNLATARALVARSGTRGMRVTVFGFDQRLGQARHFVSLLGQLGYRSSLAVLPRSDPNPAKDYYTYVSNPRNRVQIGLMGWYADLTSPALFLRDIFSCAAPAALNLSAFCDRRIDAQMKRAAALQAPDPARANALWADVDRALVDRAAAVPLVNQHAVAFVSDRVGNYQYHQQYGTLLDQLWVE